MLILVCLVIVSVALAALSLALWRMSQNIGPLDLEDYARRNHVVFIPVSEKLVEELRVPSKPVSIRLDNHRHPLLAELIVSAPEQ